MKQYQLTPQPAYAGHTITTGWNGSTFYVRIGDLSGRTRDRSINLIVPISPDTITNAATVIDLLRPYAEIPHHLHASLKADQAAEHFTRRQASGKASVEREPAAEQIAGNRHLASAEQAAATLSELKNTGQGAAYQAILALMLARAVRDLDAVHLTKMDSSTICGVLIAARTEMHFALDAPTGFLTGCVQHDLPGAHPRAILATLGYGADRYAYRDYGDPDRPLLFSLTPNPA